MTLAVRAVPDGDWMTCEPNDQIEVGGGRYWGRALARMDAEALAEYGLETADVAGVAPVQGLGDPPVLSDVEPIPTWVWSPGGLANFRLMRVLEIKAEASRRILALYPTWKQANMNMRATELADIRHDRTLTEEEETERQALLAAAAQIKDIRTASDEIEAALPTDAEGLAAFNAATDEGWPS